MRMRLRRDATPYVRLGFVTVADWMQSDWRSLALLALSVLRYISRLAWGCAYWQHTSCQRAFGSFSELHHSNSHRSVLMCAPTARSVMGKMVDAQSITIATAGHRASGNEVLFFAL